MAKWQSNFVCFLIFINKKIYIKKKRHGYGILKDSNIEIYNGDWENDQYCGQGRLRNKNVEAFSKEFDFKNFENLKSIWVSFSGEFRMS